MQRRTPSPLRPAAWPRLLGKRVRELRRRRGLTQAQLGAPALTKGFISQIENGYATASVDSLFHIAARLDVRPAELLALADPEHITLALLDVADAAVVLQGPEYACRILAKLPELLDKPGVLPSEVVLDVVATPGAVARYGRFEALVALKEGQTTRAVELLTSALSSTSRADQDLTRYWLGEAYRRAGRIRDAIRTWETLLHETACPLVRHATAQRLACLCESLGDFVEANRLRRGLNGFFPYGAETERDPAFLAEYLWTLATLALDSGHLWAASAYARPIPLVAAPAIRWEATP